MRSIQIFLLSLLLFVVLILTSALFVIGNKGLYLDGYQRYGVDKRYSIEKLSFVTDNIHDFFSDEAELDPTFFSDDEVSHMKDVRSLIDTFYFIYSASLLLLMFLVSLVVIWATDPKSVIADMIICSLIIFGLMLLLFVLLYFTLGFDWIFSKFHEIFFVGNYTFDPRVSNMKAIFPDEFFRDMAGTILLVHLVQNLLLSVFSVIFYLFKGRSLDGLKGKKIKSNRP